MEKRISVFIDRTIFFTSENLSYQHFDWLYGYTVFHTGEENRIVILLTSWPPCWEGAKGCLRLMSIKEEEFPH